MAKNALKTRQFEISWKDGYISNYTIQSMEIRLQTDSRNPRENTFIHLNQYNIKTYIKITLIFVEILSIFVKIRWNDFILKEASGICDKKRWYEQKGIGRKSIHK